jgi:hypothetical protein
METELWDSPEGRSQAGPQRDQREEARLHGLAGLRLGWSGGREPVASAKSALPAPQGKFPAVAQCGYRQSVQTPVHHAIMPGIQGVHTTGEVPRRPFPPGKVTVSYKQAVKGSPEATATGTRSLRPCPQGGQQSQSSPPTRDERQNRSRSVNPFSVFGKVSPMTAATKWPAGTSSRQLVGMLRNIPRHGVRSIRAKHQGQRLP